MLITFNSRGDVEREKKREEGRVEEIAQNLERYKRYLFNQRRRAKIFPNSTLNAFFFKERFTTV